MSGSGSSDFGGPKTPNLTRPSTPIESLATIALPPSPVPIDSDVPRITKVSPSNNPPGGSLYPALLSPVKSCRKPVHSMRKPTLPATTPTSTPFSIPGTSPFTAAPTATAHLGPWSGSRGTKPSGTHLSPQRGRCHRMRSQLRTVSSMARPQSVRMQTSEISISFPPVT